MATTQPKSGSKPIQLSADARKYLKAFEKRQSDRLLHETENIALGRGDQILQPSHFIEAEKKINENKHRGNMTRRLISSLAGAASSISSAAFVGEYLNPNVNTIPAMFFTGVVSVITTAVWIYYFLHSE